jgi:hypothetical protein
MFLYSWFVFTGVTSENPAGNVPINPNPHDYVHECYSTRTSYYQVQVRYCTVAYTATATQVVAVRARQDQVHLRRGREQGILRLVGRLKAGVVDHVLARDAVSDPRLNLQQGTMAGECDDTTPGITRRRKRRVRKKRMGYTIPMHVG